MYILDGGLGTELQSRGCDVNHPLWSGLAVLKDPQAIKSIHEDFLEAGANIITSATYQLSVPGLCESGICNSQDEAHQIMTKAVEITQAACKEYKSKYPDKIALAAASVGPYGAYLGNGSEYTGEYKGASLQQLETFHRSRLETLLAASPDIIAFETIPRLEEAIICLDLIQQLSPNTKCWLAFSIKDSKQLADGSCLTKAINTIKSRYPKEVLPNLMAIGANCFPLQHLPDLAAKLQTLDIPIILYPNSGEQYDPSTKSWSNGSSTDMSHVINIFSQPLQIYGGCCRTRPQHIAEIASSMKFSIPSPSKTATQ